MQKLSTRSTNSQLKDFYLALNASLAERGMPLLPYDVEVRWSHHMSRRTYGKAYSKVVDGKITGVKIVLNHLVFQHKSSVQLEATMRHEAAHIWTMTHCGRADHSKAWEHVAKILGDSGARFANTTDEEELKAVACAEAVPTKHVSLDKRQVHSMRCSFKTICRKYGHELTLENFDRFVRPRFPHFSSEAISEARDIICG